MRPAAVADLVRKVAAERDAADPDADVVGCWVNAGWSTGLSIGGRPDWRDPGADDGTGGPVSAVVARRRQRRGVTVRVYLVDVYRLGVKNAMGRRTWRALRRFINQIFSGYQASSVPAPIELERDLVLGGAEYAHRLRFAAHPDFEQARAHLCRWTGPSVITFGRDGKPTYVEGPYDNSRYVLRTLRRAVGRNGFHYMVALDVDGLRMTG
jgi:hypothetical protein